MTAMHMFPQQLSGFPGGGPPGLALGEAPLIRELFQAIRAVRMEITNAIGGRVGSIVFKRNQADRPTERTAQRSIAVLFVQNEFFWRFYRYPTSRSSFRGSNLMSSQ